MLKDQLDRLLLTKLFLLIMAGFGQKSKSSLILNILRIINQKARSSFHRIGLLGGIVFTLKAIDAHCYLSALCPIPLALNRLSKDHLIRWFFGDLCGFFWSLTDLNASNLLSFLDHLGKVHPNTVRTRNSRWAALRAFLHYDITNLGPEGLANVHAALAIPLKRWVRIILGFLSREYETNHSECSERKYLECPARD